MRFEVGFLATLHEGHIFFDIKYIRSVGDGVYFFLQIFKIYMSHESYHCYIYMYIYMYIYIYMFFFDICMYHDDMIIHSCVKVILYDSGDTRNLESHKSARFFAENLEEKTQVLEVRS